MTDLISTLPPSSSEASAVRAFEGLIRTLGEPQARLVHLVAVTAPERNVTPDPLRPTELLRG